MGLGGVIADNSKVTGIVPGEVVTISTANETYTADTLVLVPGSFEGLTPLS